MCIYIYIRINTYELIYTHVERETEREFLCGFAAELSLIRVSGVSAQGLLLLPSGAFSSLSCRV